MTVESRCRALLKGGHRNSNGGNQCLNNAEDGSVLCELHKGLIDELSSQGTPDFQKIVMLYVRTIMDDAVSQGMKECS